MNSSFFKTVILAYLSEKQYLTSSKVSSVSYLNRIWAEKFQGFRETLTKSLFLTHWRTTLNIYIWLQSSYGKQLISFKKGYVK